MVELQRDISKHNYIYYDTRLAFCDGYEKLPIVFSLSGVEHKFLKLRKKKFKTYLMIVFLFLKEQLLEFNSNDPHNSKYV